MRGGAAKLAGYHFNPASPDTPRSVCSLRRKLKVLRSTRSKESSGIGKVCAAAREQLRARYLPDQQREEVFLREPRKLGGNTLGQFLVILYIDLGKDPSHG